MKNMNVKRKSVNIEMLRSREALPSDCAMFIDEPTCVYEQGVLQIVYAYVPFMPPLVEALKGITYERSTRSEGLPTISRIFGYSPRSTLRKDFCAVTSLAQEYPAQHAEICKGAALVSMIYALHNPELFGQHLTITQEKVQPEWHLESTPFTSGIANKDNQLRYHFDTGNFKDVWSGMLVFKKDVAGGFLSVPQVDLCFELKDHSILLFDGQSLLHGVTPFRKLTKEAYRYSIVYYSLRQMWNCLSPTEELARIRKLKTQREYKRANLT